MFGCDPHFVVENIFLLQVIPIFSVPDIDEYKSDLIISLDLV